MGFRFREWKIYKDARQFRQDVRQHVVSKMPKSEKFELVSQLKRALDSIILNIAEGSYRVTDKDFAHFLSQAQGSLSEVVSCLDICLDDGYITNDELEEYEIKAESLAKQLMSFGKSLRQSL